MESVESVPGRNAADDGKDGVGEDSTSGTLGMEGTTGMSRGTVSLKVGANVRLDIY